MRTSETFAPRRPTADEPATRTGVTGSATRAARAVAVVRPAQVIGPQWFAAMMGTGILVVVLVSLSSTFPIAGPLAYVAAALALVVSGSIGVAFVTAALTGGRRRLTEWNALGTAVFHGSIAMGLLSVGTATGALFDESGAALAVNWVFWIVGTVIGVVAAVTFPVRLLRTAPEDRGTPTPAWALPVVAPMVSAAGAPALEATLPDTAAVMLAVLAAAFFVLAFVLGTATFGVVGLSMARGRSLPLQGSMAIWIPLGMIGQSTAAVNAAYTQWPRWFSGAALDHLHAFVVGYSVAMIVAGTATVAVAVWVSARALAAGMTFTLGWWSTTFPIGTAALGLVRFGDTVSSPSLHAAGAVACAALACTVSLCTVRSVRVWRERA